MPGQISKSVDLSTRALLELLVVKLVPIFFELLVLEAFHVHFVAVVGLF